MKKLPLITFFTVLIPFAVYTQEISSSLPNSNFRGDSDTIFVTASGTHFQQGITTVDLGPGITINNEVVVTSAESLNFWITIEENAEISQRDLIITTGPEEVSFPNAFEVLDPGAFEVVLTVIPTDPLYLSSFDPDDPVNSPMVFLIQIFNNDVDRTGVWVRFELEKDNVIIGSARKNIGDLNPGEVPPAFDNRNFDEYDIESTAGELLDEAMQTGLLPPGVYTYKIYVYEGGNPDPIGTDEGDNIVTNEIFSIDLIGPGNPTGENPEVIYSSNPYFQWFSMANGYDFTLYEVMEGQTAPDEITTNLPVYQEENLGTTQFLYPNYAELLEIGKTYAWQVKAYFEGSMGQETVFSDVYWFSYMQGEGVYLDHIVVLPEEVTLNTGETYQFHAVGINTSGDTVQINCDWQLVPSNGGSVDENGLFTAGDIPTSVATVSNFNGLQAYSTVIVNYQIEVFDDEINLLKFILEVFGAYKNN